jgi:UDP-N-acetylglucosamine 3-dehydrogenase
MRVGLIGCGHHGRNAVVAAMRKHSTRTNLVAVCDRAAELTAMVEGVNRYTDVTQMLATEKLDLIYVATLVDTHAQISIDAMRAGVDVICEKPMALQLDECQAMAAAERETGRRLFVNFETRLYPFVRQMRQWIAEGRLGRVEAIHVHDLWDGHKTQGAIGERRARLLSTSGGLDCGVHKLDIARYLAGGGAWKSLHALGAWYGEGFKYPPHAAVLARIESGPMVTVNASMGFAAHIKPRPRFEGILVIGDKGFIRAEHDLESVITGPWNEDVAKLVTDDTIETCPLKVPGHDESIGWLLDTVASVIIDGKEAPPELATAEDGVQAQWALQSANEQAAAERSGN